MMPHPTPRTSAPLSLSPACPPVRLLPRSTHSAMAKVPAFGLLGNSAKGDCEPRGAGSALQGGTSSLRDGTDTEAARTDGTILTYCRPALWGQGGQVPLRQGAERVLYHRGWRGERPADVPSRVLAVGGALSGPPWPPQHPADLFGSTCGAGGCRGPQFAKGLAGSARGAAWPCGGSPHTSAPGSLPACRPLPSAL